MGTSSAKVYIGTSGWVYKDWGKKFFPKGLPASEHLPYLATQFNTVEVNASFYRLQPKANYERWRRLTPQPFRFAVKVSRYITHIKRMKAVGAAWNKFRRAAVPLKAKQGPFLFQFPSSFTGKEEEVRRIDGFLIRLRKKEPRLRVAIEFRHARCFETPMLDVLKRHRVALVFPNSSKYPPAPWIAPADFVYFRLHGPKKLFSSSYDDTELKAQAKMMKKFRREGKDVYVYFNNDQNANAPENARTLQKLMGSTKLI
jgi:uncharacterized protein YecE (DUF72 family)